MSYKNARVALLSYAQIWIRSGLAGLAALGFAVSLQWLIYDDWLHEAGPVEIAGCVLTGVLMFLLVFRTLRATLERNKEMIRRLEAIRWMNDRIRNSLQTIECVTYAAAPQATDDVRDAVDVIEGILNDFVERHPQQAGAEALGDAQARSDPQFR